LERKLTAILCADVYGYSRLMGEDEEGTLRTLSAYRKITDSLIERHHGRFVNSAGDSILAEFASVVEAVTCAVSIQTALRPENAELPPERRMQFRIGVNLGDVMVEGEQIYGDGVNVAARLESLADPGGICISGTVHEQVRDKLALTYEDRGEQEVKNIARPVRVWRVKLDGAIPAAQGPPRTRRVWTRTAPLSLAIIAISIATFVIVQHVSFKPQHTSASIPPHGNPAPPLPSIPSIAVLPFTNLSGDPQQQYFSDGITDDLITDLSRVPKLFVIARTSSFTYKGKAEKAQSIGRELGVKYLLEGSVQRVGDQVRIDVQLVEADTGSEVWSQRYDRQMRDIFKLQDEIVQSLTTTLGLQLSMLENGIVVRERTNNLEAYDYLLRGLEGMVSQTPDAFSRSGKMFEKAIALDPDYADAYALLANLDFAEYAWNSDQRELDRAQALARQAVARDYSDSLAYAVLGMVLNFSGHPDEAFVVEKRAVALDPNNPVAYRALSEISAVLGKPEQDLLYAQTAMRLDPNHAGNYSFDAGVAYNLLGRYREAAAAFNESSETNNPWLHLGLVMAYTELGQEDDARAEASQALRLAPKLTLEDVRKILPWDWSTPVHRRFLDDLRKAGLT
jgi:adenylate cyclase